MIALLQAKPWWVKSLVDVSLRLNLWTRKKTKNKTFKGITYTLFWLHFSVTFSGLKPKTQIPSTQLCGINSVSFRNSRCDGWIWAKDRSSVPWSRPSCEELNCQTGMLCTWKVCPTEYYYATVITMLLFVYCTNLSCMVMCGDPCEGILRMADFTF